MHTDSDYIDGTIATVEAIGFDHVEENKGWVVSFTEAPGADYEMGFSLIQDPNEPLDTPPQEGDAIRVYGFGRGRSVRGVTINGKVIFYHTEREWDLYEKRYKLVKAMDVIEKEIHELQEQRRSVNA